MFSARTVNQLLLESKLARGLESVTGPFSRFFFHHERRICHVKQCFKKILFFFEQASLRVKINFVAQTFAKVLKRNTNIHLEHNVFTIIYLADVM